MTAGAVSNWWPPLPTAWHTLYKIARSGERALGKITAAVNTARRRAWAVAAARRGAIPAFASRIRCWRA